ncbi:hypothetical protein ACSSWA_12895 [Melioribacter sp. Ez-97]|uniref:hypothetical protein n=1 Tax=Melioribacter sp. Ez-97 TaxID=3423434 RepID=UPI003ED8F0B6
MRRSIVILMIFAASTLFGQFKDQPAPDIKSGILNNSQSNIFGFFSPNNFKMNHTIDVSFSSFGSAGNLALTTYTNSMFYKFNDKLDVSADISIVNTPYNTFGSGFTQNINGIYLSRAQLTYRPTENMSVILQYRNIPYSYYSPFRNYYSPFYYYGY